MSTMKTKKIITKILTTLLSIYPLFITFTIEGEIYAEKGLYASLFAQLTFWILVWISISIYFIEKINIYLVISIGILNIIFILILLTSFLNINLLQPANPQSVYTYLATSLGTSALYIWCKLMN
ncbi:hypothetical protein HMPREF0548_1489 [Lactobacillus ultunensis DSM 16047]|uniref:Uncharacterized protein n=1 Tax=Lactobacillus ultunensis DSM 16047 TaxID=525365 RepID=C2EP93_9LACO|nr:hypothetical protein HMPREF0548_1489 [Lactobacillus ultunensis DSM 16047]